jgi:hypothetical protein
MLRSYVRVAVMLDVSVFGEMSSPATGLGTARTNQVNSVFNNWRFEDVWLDR